MSTFNGVPDRFKQLMTDAEGKALVEWQKAGSVKRRWFAFIAGVVVGVAASILAHRVL